jgi:hypothetical protein
MRSFSLVHDIPVIARPAQPAVTIHVYGTGNERVDCFVSRHGGILAMTGRG